MTGSITHLFNDRQLRSFDLKTFVGDNDCYSGAFSRYALLKEFDDSGVYNGNLIHVIDFTTRKVNSSFGVQGDASFRLLYKNCGWAVGLGYNIFGRAAETLSCPSEVSDNLKGRNFGIKGTTGTCAREFVGGVLTGTSQVLNATESKTGMFNFADNGVSIEEVVFVDNPDLLLTPGTSDGFITWDSPVPPTLPTISTDDYARNSVPPVYVQDSNILFQGIPRMITHKVFAHVDYEWETCCCWQPFIGIGGEVEFAQNQGCSRLCTACEKCPNSSCEPRFWSVWIRGGMNF